MNNSLRSLSVALLLVFATSGSAQAQAQEWWGGISYQTALTTGETSDFIDQFSWRNIGFEGRRMVNENASVGMFLGLNVFNANVDGTASLGAVDITGYQSRYVNAYPLLATAHYYLGQPGGRSPRAFIGTGVGTYYVKNLTEIGITAISVDNWHFGLAPEIGIAIPSSRSTGGTVSVKYNYAFESGGVTHSYWTFGIGLFAVN